MKPVTNVSFDRPERNVFEQAFVWVGLSTGEYGNVLQRLARRDPTGMPEKALRQARTVLVEIVAKAQEDLATFGPAAKDAPETAPEHSLIANPRLIAETIVQARERALRDAGEALALIDEALTVATPADYEAADA